MGGIRQSPRLLMRQHYIWLPNLVGNTQRFAMSVCSALIAIFFTRLYVWNEKRGARRSPSTVCRL